MKRINSIIPCTGTLINQYDSEGNKKQVSLNNFSGSNRAQRRAAKKVFFYTIKETKQMGSHVIPNSTKPSFIGFRTNPNEEDMMATLGGIKSRFSVGLIAKKKIYTNTVPTVINFSESPKVSFATKKEPSATNAMDMPITPIK